MRIFKNGIGCFVRTAFKALRLFDFILQGDLERIGSGPSPCRKCTPVNSNFVSIFDRSV